MGCVQRIIRFIFSPLGRNAKKPGSAKNTFSVSSQTEISDSSACESGSKSSSGSTEISTEEGEENKQRKTARRRKKREVDSDGSSTGASENSSMLSTGDEERRRAKKKKTKNVLGESVLVEKASRKDKKHRKHKEKSVDGFWGFSSEANAHSMQDTTQDNMSRRSCVGVQKTKKRCAQAKKKDVKNFGMNAIDSRSDTQTDYSFIIDNYIGSDADAAEARSVYRQKDYSILLKNRLCEYIESLDSHKNQNISFLGL